MASERLDMAIKNFQHVNQMVERYTRLSRAYVQLSERFHQLDVEHMKLKGQMVPLLNVAQDYKTRLQALELEKANLQASLQQQTQQYQQELQLLTRTYEEKLQTLTQHVEELKPLEKLLSPDAFQHLAEAEDQIELDEATFQEMDEDASPDLSPDEKALIKAFQENPEAFLPAMAEHKGHQPLAQEQGTGDSFRTYEPIGQPMVKQAE
jgi:chromosome segregation ATPase